MAHASFARLPMALAVLLILPLGSSIAGCNSGFPGGPRCDDPLIDPDRPPFPSTPPFDAAAWASRQDLQRVIAFLRCQQRQSRAVLKRHPDDVRALGVKAYTEQALPAYEAVAEQRERRGQQSSP